MSYKLPPLPWLRAFEASARLCSFTAAAEELNLTQAAVSNQVRSLEKQLGYPLFERLSRSLKLTDMGRAYLPPVRKAFEELSASTLGLFGTGGRKCITVRAPISFAVLWLAPRLDSFRRSHPDIEIRLCSAIWAEGLAADRTDVDIRFGDGKWSGYKATRIGNEPAIAVCHPDLGRELSQGLERFSPAKRVHIMGLEDLWTRYVGRETPDEGTVGISADTSLAALEMAAAGSGAVLVLKSFAAPYLTNGRLVAPMDDVIDVGQSHYLLHGEDVPHLRPEVQIFENWLQSEAARISDPD